LVPPEIAEEFKVEDLSFENMEVNGVRKWKLVKWKDKDRFMMEKIGDEGIFHADLVNAIVEEFGISKEGARLKIQKFVERHSDEYEIVDRTVGEMVLKYVQKRR